MTKTFFRTGPPLPNAFSLKKEPNNISSPPPPPTNINPQTNHKGRSGRCKTSQLTNRSKMRFKKTSQPRTILPALTQTFRNNTNTIYSALPCTKPEWPIGRVTISGIDARKMKCKNTLTYPVTPRRPKHTRPFSSKFPHSELIRIGAFIRNDRVVTAAHHPIVKKRAEGAMGWRKVIGSVTRNLKARNIKPGVAHRNR